MTHELKEILKAFLSAGNQQKKAVLATVVALEGSAYRRPGVRMLWLEDGSAVGAVSGGCVEREVFRQAQSVFATGQPKMMTYDGRFRLGCEGILYILLEPFHPEKACVAAIQALIRERKPLELCSYFEKGEGQKEGMGTVIKFQEQRYPLGIQPVADEKDVFQQELPPVPRLMVFGGEHDAVQMAAMGSLLGWEIHITVTADEAKTKADFPGAEHFDAVIPDQLETGPLDKQTAVLLMTHSYTKDLKYLLKLCDSQPAYLGLLGPAHRRERLLNDLVERRPELEEAFFERIYGPSGLDLGGETAQEICLSVLSEILSVFRDSSGKPLREKEGGIHHR